MQEINMVDLFFADLVRETSETSGTGLMELTGATPGYRAFADVVPEGARFHYAIAGVTDERQWEIGTGHLDSEGKLERSPLRSSNANSLVDFSPGLKIISLTVASTWFTGRVMQ